MNEFKLIDHLVCKEGFSFQSWDDRYSAGIWAALGTTQFEIDIVRDLSFSGDFEMLGMKPYIFSADWLPYVTGNSLLDAITNLEERLSTLPKDQLNGRSHWSTLVSEAIHNLGSAWDQSLKKNVHLCYSFQETLPKSFEDARLCLLQKREREYVEYEKQRE